MRRDLRETGDPTVEEAPRGPLADSPLILTICKHNMIVAEYGHTFISPVCCKHQKARLSLQEQTPLFQHLGLTKSLQWTQRE